MGKKEMNSGLVSVEKVGGVVEYEGDLSPRQLAREKKLVEAGVTRKKVYQTLNEGLSATKILESENDRLETVREEVPDHLIRHKFLETALKVFGDIKPESFNVGVGVSLKVSQEEKELLEAYKRV